MLLMAAFVVLPAHYSGQRDIVLRSPTANRLRNKVEPLIVAAALAAFLTKLFLYWRETRPRLNS